MTTNDPRKTELIQILREKSVRRGDFTLASGKKSDLYVDVRQTSLHARGAQLIYHLWETCQQSDGLLVEEWATRFPSSTTITVH